MLQYAASIEPILQPPPPSMILAVLSSSNDDIVPDTPQSLHAPPSESPLTTIERHSLCPPHIHPNLLSTEMSPERGAGAYLSDEEREFPRFASVNDKHNPSCNDVDVVDDEDVPRSPLSSDTNTADLLGQSDSDVVINDIPEGVTTAADNLQDVLFSTPCKPGASAAATGTVRGTNMSVARTIQFHQEHTLGFRAGTARMYQYV